MSDDQIPAISSSETADIDPKEATTATAPDVKSTDEPQSSTNMSSSGVGPIRNAVRNAVSSASTASTSTRPLSGIFAINKPSGPTSMSLLDDLKPLFATSPLFAEADGRRPKDASRKKFKGKWRGGVAGAPKLGQGGTLDPLADGVLVVGVGSGTKHLQKYLDCTKEYRSTGLLGSATTSYDCCDPILTRKEYSHVTPERIAELLPRFTGVVSQIPPLYSAVRIDGKRLFEYARENLPLPRPIEPRKVTVHELRLVDWLEPGKHPFKEPEREVPEEDKALVGRVLDMAGRKEGQTDTVKEEADSKQEDVPVTSWKRLPTAKDASAQTDDNKEGGTEAAGPPAFVLEMTVSSGTYVRSIVHDLAIAAGSAAHVQTLTRTRQGEWSIDSASQDGEGIVRGNCIEWKVFADAIEDMRREKTDSSYKEERDDEGLRSWERELLKFVVPV